MFRNLEAEQARFGYTNQQMADKSMMFATDNEPREKGDDNDRNDGYFWLSRIADVLHHRPGDGQAVKGAGASANLI